MEFKVHSVFVVLLSICASCFFALQPKLGEPTFDHAKYGQVVFHRYRGLNEPIIWVLAYINLTYEEFRFRDEDWATIKHCTPFGQVPLMRIENTRYHQSVAISRLHGKMGKIAGNDFWENLMIDMMVDTAVDFYRKVRKWNLTEIPTKRRVYRDDITELTIPYYLRKFNAAIKKNNGFLALNRITWGDLYFVAVLELIKDIIGFDTTRKYKYVKRLRDQVLENPEIKECVNRKVEYRTNADW